MQAQNPPPPIMEVEPRMRAMMEVLGLRQTDPVLLAQTSTVVALNGVQDIPAANMIVHGQLNEKNGWFAYLCVFKELDRVIGGRYLTIGPDDTIASHNDELTTSKLVSIRTMVHHSRALHMAAHCKLATTAFDTEAGAAEARALIVFTSHAVIQKVYAHAVMTLLNAPFMSAGVNGNRAIMYPLQYLYGNRPSATDLILSSARCALAANVGRHGITAVVSQIMAHRSSCGLRPFDTVYMSQALAAILNAPSLQTSAHIVGDSGAASADRGESLQRVGGLPIVPINLSGPQDVNVCPFDNQSVWAQHYVAGEHAALWSVSDRSDRAFKSLEIGTFNARTLTAEHLEIPLKALVGAPIWHDAGWTLNNNVPGVLPAVVANGTSIDSMFYPAIAGQPAATFDALWDSYIRPILPAPFAGYPTANIRGAMADQGNLAAGGGGAVAMNENEFKTSILYFLGKLCQGCVLKHTVCIVQYCIADCSSMVLSRKHALEVQLGPVHATKEPNASRHMVTWGFDALGMFRAYDPTETAIMTDVWGVRLTNGNIGSLNSSILVPEVAPDAAAVGLSTLRYGTLPRFGRNGPCALAYLVPPVLPAGTPSVPAVLSITGDVPAVFEQLARVADTSDDLAFSENPAVSRYYYAKYFNSDYEAAGMFANPCMAGVREAKNRMPDDTPGLSWGSLQGYQVTYKPGGEKVVTVGVSPLARFCDSTDHFRGLLNDYNVRL